MKVSLDGLIENSARTLQQARDGQHAYALRELAKHLIELRDRTEKGDFEALDEFFSLYVVSHRPAYQRFKGYDDPFQDDDEGPDRHDAETHDESE